MTRPTPAESVRRDSLLHALQTAVEGDQAAVRGAIEPKAWALLADDEWWAEVAPWLAEALGPVLEEYDQTPVAWWEGPGDRREVAVRSTFGWGWDPLLAELLVGLAARLGASDDPGVQLVGLKARRWLGYWLADTRRQRGAAEALGLSFPPPPVWPASMIFPHLVLPKGVLSVDGVRATPEHRDGFDLSARMVVRACMGLEVFAFPMAKRRPPRPWLWCWELEAMPPRVLRWSADGDPVPVPVVVPADFDPVAMPDRYGFAVDAMPGEVLVVDDPERVLEAWSGRLVHHGPWGWQGTVNDGYTPWRRGHPVPMSRAEVARRRPRPEPEPEPLAEVVEMFAAPAAEPAPVPAEPPRPPSPTERIEAMWEARQRALDAWVGPWSMGGE